MSPQVSLKLGFQSSAAARPARRLMEKARVTVIAFMMGEKVVVDVERGFRGG